MKAIVLPGVPDGKGVPAWIKRKAIDELERELSFSVRDDHVAGSTVRDCHNCAAARGLRDVPGIVDAYVLKTRAYTIHRDGSIFRRKMPTALTRTVATFDWTAGIFPVGRYVLKPMHYSETTEARKGRQRSYNGKVDEKKRQREYTPRPTYGSR